MSVDEPSASTGRFAASRIFVPGWNRSTRAAPCVRCPWWSSAMLRSCSTAGGRAPGCSAGSAVPAEGIDVMPDVVVSPVVGFDPACYRLGYGGGFYDRTLAAMARQPRVIGVGFALAAIATIHPLPHDIPMQAIVTERGCSVPRDSA